MINFVEAGRAPACHAALADKNQRYATATQSPKTPLRLGIAFDVVLGERDALLVEIIARLLAVPAPAGGIHDHFFLSVRFIYGQFRKLQRFGDRLCANAAGTQKKCD